MVDRGAILRINFFYKCATKYPDCVPKIDFEEVTDDNEPEIEVEDSFMYMIGDKEYRDHMKYSGIRLLVNVKGVANTVSIPAIIL